jgi:hypothetical protein
MDHEGEGEATPHLKSDRFVTAPHTALGRELWEIGAWRSRSGRTTWKSGIRLQQQNKEGGLCQHGSQGQEKQFGNLQGKAGNG